MDRRSEKYPEGMGSQPEHAHEPVVHSHEHYHVTHLHDGGLRGDWDHLTSHHVHLHDHHRIVHCHHYSESDEEEGHGEIAHVHDHGAPVHR